MTTGNASAVRRLPFYSPTYHSDETSLAKYFQMVSVFSKRNSWVLLGVKKLDE